VKKKEKLLKAAVVTVSAAAVILLAVTGIRLIKHFGNATTATTVTAPVNDGKYRPALDVSAAGADANYTRKKHVESYLLLGVDKTAEQLDSGLYLGQADVLLLLVMDRDEATYHLLQINRDTSAYITVLGGDGDITAEKFGPICLAYGQGTGGLDSCENVVRSVEYLLADVTVDGVIALRLDALGVLNDAVGGVTVTVEQDMTAADPALKAGATVKLDAATAERYVRARMILGEDDNQKRMERQTNYMAAWVRAAKTLDSRQLVALLETIQETCLTDLTEKRLSGLADDLRGYENGGFVTIDGHYEQGEAFKEFRADDESILEAVLQLYYTQE